MTGRDGEATTLQELLDHLKLVGEGGWEKERKPDEEVRDQHRPDYIICQRDTGKRAAVEITAFDWPPDDLTFLHSMLAVLREVPARCMSSAQGVFSITVDSLATWERDVFASANREKTKQTLADAIDNMGTAMKPGEWRLFRDPFEFTLSRGPAGGPLCVTAGYHFTRDSAAELRDLEEVLRDNARKFKDFSHLRRVVAVVYGGIVDDLWLIGPMLRVPREIDDLFFVVREASRTQVLNYRDISTLPFPVALVPPKRKVTPHA
jgi:hypothetical protein